MHVCCIVIVQYIYYQQQYHKKMILYLFLSLVVTYVHTSCSDQLKCFKNKLFNFGSAAQNIYLLSSITSTNEQNQLNVLAYGDFNNDLQYITDFVAKTASNDSIVLYVWNAAEEVFVYQQLLNTSQCPVISVYLYDADLNGLLDIVVWGTVNNQNCLLPFIQQSGQTYSKSPMKTTPPTSNPFLLSFGANNAQKTITLALYQTNTRILLKYEPTSQNLYSFPSIHSTTIKWSSIFTSNTNSSSVAFANYHWNSYVDLTGDCQADVVVYNNMSYVEFWIANGDNTFRFAYQMYMADITGFTFADMNYDGVVDMVVAKPNQITVYFNTRKLAEQDDFCKQNYKTVSFDFSQGYVVTTFPQSTSMPSNQLQIKDINLDGFADMLVILKLNQQQYTVKIYISDQSKSYAENQQYKLPIQTFNNVISASFIDFWENGIIDVIVCSTGAGLQSFYNNYLQQNLFFIKGYGASGDAGVSGAQIIGASFYWVNSVGDGYRTTYQPQIIQTAYNALQTPYAYCGLGRSNSYVQSFTLGVFGNKNSWSPIIPNSQLAVYAQGAESQKWTIKIFVLPTQSLIYVIIVSVVVLSVLGLVLLVLKFRNFRKKDQPMMQFIH